jgi:hypothetical protein
MYGYPQKILRRNLDIRTLLVRAGSELRSMLLEIGRRGILVKEWKTI